MDQLNTNTEIEATGAPIPVISKDLLAESFRPELIHRWGRHSGRLDLFLEEIDKTGGWPNGYRFVSFYHGVEDDERKCKFGNRNLREPYWTTVCSSDDYYWWKLSDAKKAEAVATARRQIINSLR